MWGRVYLLFKRGKKTGDDEFVWGVQAARILRISRVTFWDRFKHNQYPQMVAIRTTKGLKYRLRDVIRAAHPRVSEKKIDELVIFYRTEGFKQQKRGRK